MRMANGIDASSRRLFSITRQNVGSLNSRV